jgi:UDP-glucose 4-epimerase
MRLTITGGAGFVGSHLCDKYVKEGEKVVCFDDFSSGSIWNVRHLLDSRNFKLVKGTITDYPALEKAAADSDTMIHAAAQVHVDRSYIQPQLTYQVNVAGTQNVLEAGRMLEIEKVLYASSSEVYGSAQQVPIGEGHPLDAPHPYGASKIAADRMCHAYIKTYGMDVRILRCFNIYGPRQKDFGYGGVISLFVRRVIQNVPPVVYGEGTQTRDYTFVSDAVKAYDLMMRRESPVDGPVNFGTGVEIKIADLADLIIDLCGKKGSVSPVHVGPRIAEVERLVCDPKKARELLGWEPEYTLKKGLAEFIEWYQKFGFEVRGSGWTG